MMVNKFKLMLATMLFSLVVTNVCLSETLDFSLLRNNLTGMCLDNHKAGCQSRYLPFKGLMIDFCEETCTLTNPVDIRGINEILYDFECTSDYAPPFLSQVLLTLRKNHSGSSDLMFVRSAFLKGIGSSQVSTPEQTWSVVKCH